MRVGLALFPGVILGGGCVSLGMGRVGLAVGRIDLSDETSLQLVPRTGRASLSA